MIDIRKDFNDSFNLLLHHKNMIIPILCSIALPMILIFLFLNLSGLNPLVKEMISLKEQFDMERTDRLLDGKDAVLKDFDEDNMNNSSLGQEDEDDEFIRYLKEKDYDLDRFKELLFDSKNIMMLVIFLLTGIVGSFYFSCMSYAMVALSIKNIDISPVKLLKVTNRFFLKLFSLRLLLGFIMVAPMIMMIGIIILISFIDNVMGILSAFILIILFIVYLVVLGLRFFFSVPSMYIDESGAVESIKHSFYLTKGHLKQVIVISFLLYGIMVFMNSFIRQPLHESFSGFLFDTGMIKISVNLLVVFVFLVLESIVFTFEHIFLFYSYIDFKNLEEITR